MLATKLFVMSWTLGRCLGHRCEREGEGKRLKKKWVRVAVSVMKIMTAVQVGHNEEVEGEGGNHWRGGRFFFEKVADGPAE